MIVNTEGPADARMFFVGEAPGKDEDLTGRPFMGYAGKTLNWLLSQAGISRPEVLIGNVARERPPANKISFFFEDKNCTVPKPKLQEWINKLKAEILTFHPNVVVALGSTALWALTGEKTVGKFRGYIMNSTLCPGVKVIPTYHPQNVNYEWKNFFPTVLDFKKAKYHSHFSEMYKDSRVLYPDAKLSEFIQYCRELLEHKEWSKLVVDVETVQPGTHIEILGLAHSKEFAMNISLIKGISPCLSENEEVELFGWLSQVLQEKEIIIHNAQYDDLVLLYNHGLKSKIYMDTLIAAHALWPELPRDLGFLASLCLDVPAWKHTASENRPLYNCGDCANTFGIAEFFEEEMVKQNVKNTFDFEMSQLEVAEMMQVQGIHVDKEVQKRLINESSTIIEETGDALSKVFKTPIYDRNTKKSVVNSYQKLQKMLYIDLGLPVQYKRRKRATDPKKITSDSEALNRLKLMFPTNPVLDLTLEHKRYMKLRDSFLDIDLSPASRAHTSYNITGKKDNKDDSKLDEEGKKSFGRWSSSKSIIFPYGSGNLQNVPPIARKMYVAPEGMEWGCGDLVQAEAVVIAYLTEDNIDKQLFKQRLAAKTQAEKSKFDVHKRTAMSMYGVKELDLVTVEQRRIGKTLRHAISYDAGPSVIAAKVGCSLNEGKRLKEMYHAAKPKLRVWYSQIQDKLSKDRTLITPMGRKHRFLDRWGDDLFRSAYAFLPQSTVGDILNTALVRLYQRCGHYFSITLQLHDAIYALYQIEKRDWILSRMKDLMEQVVIVNQDEMLIETDFKVGSSWGEMEDYELKYMKEEVLSES